MSNSDSRVTPLDVLRGIAALSVVLFHYTVKFADFYPAAAPAPGWFRLGFYGVHLFFMISGFVILMTLDRSNGAGFIRSRFTRLYPLFWASVLLTFVVMTSTNVIPFALGPADLLVNLTMLQDYFKVPPVDGVYWSLTYELGFYFFMYWIFRLGFRRWIDYLPIQLVAAAMLFVLAKPYIPHPLHFLLVFHQYAHLFAVGLALYLLRQRGFRAIWVAALLAAPAVQYEYDGWPGLIAIAIAEALMCAATLRRTPLPACWRPLIALGGISYGLYLTHQMIGYVLLARLEQQGLAPALAIPLCIASMLALAALMTYAVERPVANALRRTSKAGEPVTAAGAREI